VILVVRCPGGGQVKVTNHISGVVQRQAGDLAIQPDFREGRPKLRPLLAMAKAGGRSASNSREPPEPLPQCESDRPGFDLRRFLFQARALSASVEVQNKVIDARVGVWWRAAVSVTVRNCVDLEREDAGRSQSAIGVRRRTRSAIRFVR